MTETAGSGLINRLDELLHTIDENNISAAADRLFDEDGNLQEAFNKSVLYYSLRRILHTINFKIETQEISISNSEAILELTKEYFLENTLLPYDSPIRNELSILVLSCIDANRKGISKGLRRKIIDGHKQRGVKFCYMCGVGLDYDTPDKNESATLDHVFPHEFGGDSEDENLLVACKRCNDNKGSHISGPDFHFEAISTKHNIDHPKFRGQLFKNPNPIAFRSINDFKCSICSEPASEAGFLEAYRLNEKDGWHFMNIGCKCSKHDL